MAIYKNICSIRSKSLISNITRTASSFEKQIPLLHSWNPHVEPGWTCEGEVKEGSGLVIGAYPFNDDPAQHTVCLTKTAAIFNEHTQNKLIEFLAASGPFPELGEARTFFKLEPTFTAVTIVGLGCKDAGFSKREARDEGKENIRKAVGAGVRALQALNINKIYVEDFGHAESTAEGAALALWANQDLKDAEKRKIKIPDLDLFGCCDWKGWRVGLEKAEAQNFARRLMETPANLMTPRSFALATIDALCETSVNVEVRVEDWLREMDMNAFLAVAKGSVQPPIFLEMNYNGCERDVPPVILVGKGLTFNSGGLCLKTPGDMKHMRGDMAGAAVVVSTFKALSNLGLPINVRGLVPLCENMPGASASRPGDIVKALNGKSILVGDKYFDGQLLLADALSYAHRYNPKYIIDVGTITKEMQRTLGSTASGVYTNNEILWQLLKAASVHSGDRLWRFPLWNIYSNEVTDKIEVDVSNMTRSGTGVSSTAAAFLREFIVKNNWAHIDIYGTMMEDGKTPYLRKGMAGRPTRTLIEFLGQLACMPLKKEKENNDAKTSDAEKVNSLNGNNKNEAKEESKNKEHNNNSASDKENKNHKNNHKNNNHKNNNHKNNNHKNNNHKNNNHKNSK